MATAWKQVVRQLVERVPQSDIGGVLWVLTGGVSAYLLANNDKRSILGQATWQRSIHDVDIFSFRQSPLSPKSGLCVLEWSERAAKAVDVSSTKKVRSGRIYIDSCREFHFEFGPPTEIDVIELACADEKYISVNATYLVAFKLFGAMRFRQKDLDDCKKILAVNEVELSRVIEILDRNAHGAVICNSLQRYGAHWVEAVSSGQVFSHIGAALIEMLCVVAPHVGIDYSKLNYDLLSSLFNFFPLRKITREENLLLDAIGIETSGIPRDYIRYTALLVLFGNEGISEEEAKIPIRFAAKMAMDIHGDGRFYFSTFTSSW